MQRRFRHIRRTLRVSHGLAGRLAAIVATVLVAAVGVHFLLQPSDGGRERSDEAAPVEGAATSAAPERPAARPSADGGERGLPARPARNPQLLARQLGRAEAIIQDPSSSRRQLAEAGRLQQLATGVLLRWSPEVRADVYAQLDRRAAASMRTKVAAAQALGGLTGAEADLPDWRIVRPPPPAVLLRHYRDAQKATGVPWQYLAAINLVETRMGRIRGTSSAGAQGPMQFMPGTWAMYGRGDVHDHRDSIMAAARLLRANGAPNRMDEAIYRYNLSRDYVRAVKLYAAHMKADPRAYHGYYHWQVLYRHVNGLVLLPEGYPRARPSRVGS